MLLLVLLLLVVVEAASVVVVGHFCSLLPLKLLLRLVVSALAFVGCAAAAVDAAVAVAFAVAAAAVGGVGVVVLVGGGAVSGRFGSDHFVSPRCVEPRRAISAWRCLVRTATHSFSIDGAPWGARDVDQAQRCAREGAAHRDPSHIVEHGRVATHQRAPDLVAEDRLARYLAPAHWNFKRPAFRA